MVVGSALAHVGLMGLVLATPGERSMLPPQVISVDLIGAPAASAPARAAPKPAPAQAPDVPVPAPAPPPEPAKPEPPKPKEIVLPEKPQAPPKPATKPKPREREVFHEPSEKKEKSLEELLAEMRTDQPDKSREELLAEMRGQAGEGPAAPVDTSVAPSPGAAPGAGQQVSAETLDWVSKVKRHVRRVWVVPPGFRTQSLETHVVVSLDAGGNVLGEPRIVKRSGNPWFDEGVVRGISKSTPLPPPPDAGDWDFVFIPGDSL